MTLLGYAGFEVKRYGSLVLNQLGNNAMHE